MFGQANEVQTPRLWVEKNPVLYVKLSELETPKRRIFLYVASHNSLHARTVNSRIHLFLFRFNKAYRQF